MKVAPGGYAWWYVDALSHDGRHGLTIIAFVGSVFSPYYAAARRRGGADPENHVAVNAALYGPRGSRWAMTERRRGALRRGADHLVVGPSTLAWDGAALAVNLDEVTVPIPGRIRGRVTVRPLALPALAFALDAPGKHVWQPIAPLADVEVSLERPALAWHGTGYFDHNRGDEPLETGFVGWDWSRGTRDRETIIFYDQRPRGSRPITLALRATADGRIEAITPPPQAALPKTLWRIGRTTRAEDRPQVIRTVEDTPFYARSLVSGNVGGAGLVSVHESLALERFVRSWVRALLPFRMPRTLR